MSKYTQLAELHRRFKSELESIDNKIKYDTFVSQASLSVGAFKNAEYDFKHITTLIDINRQALIDTRDILTGEFDKLTTKLEAVEALLND